jgi:hypothetical protein
LVKALLRKKRSFKKRRRKEKSQKNNRYLHLPYHDCQSGKQMFEMNAELAQSDTKFEAEEG